MPTLVVESSTARAPTAGRGSPDLHALAQSLDAALIDAAQDLGLVVDLTRPALSGGRRADVELASVAASFGEVVVAPSVEVAGGQVELRLVLADPGAKALRVRLERASGSDAVLRAVVMLRDLVAGLTASSNAALPSRVVEPRPFATPARSAGRTSLLANATLLGGLAGYSVQRSSGSDDPRLLYPLLAVGAGVGLGASILIAEEWDVGVGDAWFLAAGAWWPTLAGHLIYEGRFAHAGQPTDERWAFGLVGATTGLTLATLGLSLHGMSDGGALMASSGGGLGLVMGGLLGAGVRGDVHQTPFAGMGYGAAFGWVAASAVALHWAPPPSRVLAVDLGALLGGLGGAALASPLLFNDSTRLDQRGWLATSGAGALVGAGLAWYWTRPPRGPSVGASVAERITGYGMPMLGVLGDSVRGAEHAPILGAGFQGVWH